MISKTIRPTHSHAHALSFFRTTAAAAVQFPSGVTPVDDHDVTRLELFLPRPRIKHAAGTQRRAPSALRSTEATIEGGGGLYVRPFDSEAFKREMRSVKCANHWQGESRESNRGEIAA